jgi:hypothetical protein
MLWCEIRWGVGEGSAVGYKGNGCIIGLGYEIGGWIIATLYLLL